MDVDPLVPNHFLLRRKPRTGCVPKNLQGPTPCARRRAQQTQPKFYANFWRNAEPGLRRPDGLRVLLGLARLPRLVGLLGVVRMVGALR
jgi:hypothetical protein